MDYALWRFWRVLGAHCDAWAMRCIRWRNAAWLRAARRDRRKG